MQFEKDVADPFNIDEMIKEATGGAAGGGAKRYGVQDDSDPRASKRARVDDDEK